MHYPHYTAFASFALPLTESNILCGEVSG